MSLHIKIDIPTQNKQMMTPFIKKKFLPLLVLTLVLIKNIFYNMNSKTYISNIFIKFVFH